MEILATLFNGLGSTAIMLVAMVILFMEIKGVKSEMKDMKSEIKGVKSEIKDMKSEMKAEFANVRAEMKEESTNIRAEMKAEFVNIRAEISDLRHEVHTNSERLQDLAERVSHQEGVEMERRYSRIPEAV